MADLDGAFGQAEHGGDLGHRQLLEIPHDEDLAVVRGQLVQRVLDFPGCWNGVDLDSTNHRTHTAFADATTGACPEGFKAIPQLRITLSYRVPAGASFAVDTFPEDLRKAITDHNDFENVMPAGLMRLAVNCINRGIRC